MVAPETAGAPMREPQWVRRSVRAWSEALGPAGHDASAPPVRRLLKKHADALRVNAKEKEARSQPPERETQCRYIEPQKQAFAASGDPYMSVATKTKALSGNCKNAGQAWGQDAEAVNVHDFLSDALGRGAPEGIFARARHAGGVYVGQSVDPPEFAGEALTRWWQTSGHAADPKATRLLILADAGGSNGCRPRLWKEQLQSQRSHALGLSITVCHYPPGGSQWNPMEHRLLSQMSIHWVGKPLRTFETRRGLRRGTTTHSGLKVLAHLLAGVFETGKKVTAAVMKTLNMTHHETCPQWNYTIHPHLGHTSGS